MSLKFCLEIQFWRFSSINLFRFHQRGRHATPLTGCTPSSCSLEAIVERTEEAAVWRRVADNPDNPSVESQQT